jgi:hypothetical protein
MLNSVNKVSAEFYRFFDSKIVTKTLFAGSEVKGSWWQKFYSPDNSRKAYAVNSEYRACGLGYSRSGVCVQPLLPEGDNFTQLKQQRLASAVGGQLGLQSPLLRRTCTPQGQQTERKRREWPSPQEQLRN